MYYTLQSPSLFTMEPPSAARQLIILLHGVGSLPAAMLGMAESFRSVWPQAAIAIPPGSQPFDGADPDQAHPHHQWFSIQGVSESNRFERVSASMPAFISTIRSIQETTLVPPADTVLAGFSQGAIMALEAIKVEDGLAGRVLAFSGRYARLPETAPKWTSISLYHGDLDEVIAVDHAKDAFEHLHELGADVTLDIAHGSGHEAHPALVAQAVERLQKQLPARLWKQALSGPPR